ncbi:MULTISPECIES: LacI family DNA-binding transcriptional regulator [Arthrobacter]|uniref:LacI family DNA-binding transcriptional regulator n=1 Tax=unclassified Arthrobacter TaxID=235627 RepID=UPI0024B8FCC2|nr:LacI family DNA-binding transcriptional regulator [Arthrobacter sp. H35-MC1]MDJ0316781.1 LacI family DNA-binding transcriptional regulator [Arthrobacter sp. H35-MC1]
MRVSIDDVAERAEVSTATVSRALRGLPKVHPTTRARVLAVAKEMGYVASPSATRLATGQMKTVGVLVPFIDRWYFARALEGIDQELREHGFNLMLFSLGGYMHGQQRRFTEQMVRKQIDALVVLCLGLSATELGELQRTHVPTVSVGGPVEGCQGIHIDDAAAAAAATQHLIDLGHRKIGHLRGGINDEKNFVVPTLRSAAFEATMLRAGLELRPEWNVVGDYTVGEGVAAAARLFDLPGEAPTAIFCGSDEMALGLMFEAQRRGIRIPEDLSVVGIDDHDFAGPAGLSTIGQKPADHGRLAAKMLLAEVSGKIDSIRAEFMPFSLIKRGSTAPWQEP